MKWPGMGEYGDVNEGEGSVHLPFTQVDVEFFPKLMYGYRGYTWPDDLCPHVKDNKIERVLVLTSQDGYTGAGICLDCLMEWAERNRSRIWKGEGE